MLSDVNLDWLDETIENTMGKHEVTKDDRGWPVCTCGARDNMDGDVLFSHRISVVCDAVHGVLEKLLSPPHLMLQLPSDHPFYKALATRVGVGGRADDSSYSDEDEPRDSAYYYIALLCGGLAQMYALSVAKNEDGSLCATGHPSARAFDPSESKAMMEEIR